MPAERTIVAATPRYYLESLRELNPAAMWADFFIAPAIALMDSYRVKPFPCLVVCENIASALLDDDASEIAIEYDWLAETFPECSRLFHTLQRDAVVEYAAVAAAFLLVTNIARKNITEVTLRGDRADYFLEGRNLLLEISGTENAGLLAVRRHEKIRQLQANPFGKDGYVFVCCFSNQKAKFSFHRLSHS